MSVYIGKGVLAEGVYDESGGLGFCRHEHPVVLFDNPVVVSKSSGVVEGGFHEVTIVLSFTHPTLPIGFLLASVTVSSAIGVFVPVWMNRHLKFVGSSNLRRQADVDGEVPKCHCG